MGWNHDEKRTSCSDRSALPDCFLNCPHGRQALNNATESANAAMRKRYPTRGTYGEIFAVTYQRGNSITSQISVLGATEVCQGCGSSLTVTPYSREHKENREMPDKDGRITAYYGQGGGAGIEYSYDFKCLTCREGQSTD